MFCTCLLILLCSKSSCIHTPHRSHNTDHSSKVISTPYMHCGATDIGGELRFTHSTPTAEMKLLLVPQSNDVKKSQGVIANHCVLYIHSLCLSFIVFKTCTYHHVICSRQQCCSMSPPLCAVFMYVCPHPMKMHLTLNNKQQCNGTE